jgi:methyltransferase-like protein 6
MTSSTLDIAGEQSVMQPETQTGKVDEFSSSETQKQEIHVSDVKKYVEVTLAETAKSIIEKQNAKTGLKDFWKQKILSEADKYWDKFYKRNSTNFFKDRHWTWREFPELLQANLSILEVGCGVGNFFFPLLQENLTVQVHACDFSAHAIKLIHKQAAFDSSRINAFTADLTKNALRQNIPESVDIISCLFVLSAVPPEKMKLAVQNMAEVLKQDGLLLFRDYGIYDGAQLRFKHENVMNGSLYVRQDWTLSYFFTMDEMTTLFCQDGLFETVDASYEIRKLTNAKTEMSMGRNFVQARFRRTNKPAVFESTS